MSNKYFTTRISVDQTPKQVFDAINDVAGWWSGEIEGNAGQLGDEFTYRYKNFHRSRQRVTELVSGKKVVWLVLESSLNFVEDKSEWNGTRISFEIAKKGNKTQIRFTHVGLAPDHECYGACSNAWGSLINGNLRSLITTGKRSSNQKL
jgi:hypothetical protein